MKRSVLSLSTAVAVGLAATAASAQYVPLFRFDPSKAAQAAGKKLFSDHCAVCHAQVKGVRAYGPSLAGVVGRRAAATDFPYSDALKKSGLTWTDDNLRQWITDPAHMVPNTLMLHPAISDPAEQVYVIAYLKTLKPPATR